MPQHPTVRERVRAKGFFPGTERRLPLRPLVRTLLLTAEGEEGGGLPPSGARAATQDAAHAGVAGTRHQGHPMTGQCWRAAKCATLRKTGRKVCLQSQGTGPHSTSDRLHRRELMLGTPG